jgi:small subunit ribosomal protein S3Ae
MLIGIFFNFRQQVKKIRSQMNQILLKEASKNNITDYVRWLLTEVPSEEIIKACRLIYPLNNVVVRKIKMLKKAKLDIQKLDYLYKENIVSEKKVNKKRGEK